MVSVAGGVIVSILIIAVLSCVGYFAWSYMQSKGRGASQRLDDPFADPYSSRRMGPIDWIADKLRQFKLRRSRTAAGAFEPQGPTHHPDHDDAWDSHVGNETDGYGPYSEEQELGAVPTRDTAYHGSGGIAKSPVPHPDRARSKSREKAPAAGLDKNPFGDDAELSNIDARSVRSAGKGKEHSPERRSIFREEI